MRKVLQRLFRRLSSYELSVFLLASWGLYAVMLSAWGAASPRIIVRSIAHTAPFLIVYSLLVINLALCTYKSILRARAWATTVSHAAGFLIVAGVLVSSSTRFEGEALVVEDHTFWGDKADYIRTSGRGLPEVSFLVKSIVPEFWGDKLLFTDLAALVAYPADTMERSRVIRLSSPASIGGVRINIENFSYTPDYVVIDRDGREIDSGTAVLTIFPPGTVDSFQPRGLPHRIYVSLFPDFIRTDKKASSRTMNLRNPVFGLRVMRGKTTVFQGLAQAGEGIHFDGLVLSLPGVRRWGQFRVVRDQGVPFVLSGFLLGCLGLAWRFLPWTR